MGKGWIVNVGMPVPRFLMIQIPKRLTVAANLGAWGGKGPFIPQPPHIAGHPSDASRSPEPGDLCCQTDYLVRAGTGRRAVERRPAPSPGWRAQPAPTALGHSYWRTCCARRDRPSNDSGCPGQRRCCTLRTEGWSRLTWPEPRQPGYSE